MKTMQEVQAAPTPDLIAFYNKKTGKNLKRFANRETAVQRVAALLPARRPTPMPKKQPTGSTISEAVKKSWGVPEVAAARRKRDAVIVAGERYKSVREAFRQLNLPDSKHIAFRGELKAKGKAEVQGYKFSIAKEDKE
jgi:hypothetical protein